MIRYAIFSPADLGQAENLAKAKLCVSYHDAGFSAAIVRTRLSDYPGSVSLPSGVQALPPHALATLIEACTEHQVVLEAVSVANFRAHRAKTEGR